jgi:hypothetical protein
LKPSKRTIPGSIQPSSQDLSEETAADVGDLPRVLSDTLEYDYDDPEPAKLPWIGATGRGRYYASSCESSMRRGDGLWLVGNP